MKTLSAPDTKNYQNPPFRGAQKLRRNVFLISCTRPKGKGNYPQKTEKCNYNNTDHNII